MRKFIPFLVSSACLVLFMSLLSLAASAGLFREEVIYYASKGEVITGALMQSPLLAGLYEPPTAFEGKPTLCTAGNFGGSVYSGSCYGLSSVAYTLKLCNDKNTFIKASLADCKDELKVDGPILIGPNSCNYLTCPAGSICKPVFTEWSNCGKAASMITGQATGMAKKECTPKAKQGCVGNNLYWYDSCGKPEMGIIRCAYGCADSRCNSAYDINQPTNCGDGYCVPPKESCSSCSSDCGICINQETEMNTDFPIGTSLLIGFMLLLVLAVGSKLMLKNKG